MSGKGRTTLEDAADKINEVVEDLTLEALELRLSATPSALQRRPTSKSTCQRFRKAHPFPVILTRHPQAVLLVNVRDTWSDRRSGPRLCRSPLETQQNQRWGDQRKEDQR
jgi:hypothetical protein